MQKRHYILFFDVVVKQTGSNVATICEPKKGTQFFAVTKHFESQDSNMGEITALLIGLAQAQIIQANKIVVTEDSLVILQAVNDSNSTLDWTI